MSASQEHASPIRLAMESPFQLGETEVRPATRQFLRDGRGELLEPRVMQVLVALYRAHGEVVSRETLLLQCWDGRTVGDNAIHRVIAKIRALGAGGFTVETIAKVGYRLVVEAEGMTDTAPPQTAASTSIPQSFLNQISRRHVLAVGASAAVVAGVGVVALFRSDPDAERVTALLAQAEHARSLGMPASEAQGIGFLEEAVSLRPRNANAWGRLALARSVAAEYSPPDQAADIVARTQEAAQGSLALDQKHVDALAGLALLPSYYGDWFAAEARMESVLALHPDHVPTRDALDFMYVAVGRCREGCLSRLRYAEGRPLDAHLQYRLVYALWMLGRLGEADRLAERGLQLWPRHPGVWFSHLWTLAFTERAERALAHVENVAGRPELPSWMVEALALSMTAMSTHRRADIDRASDVLLALLQRGPSHSVNAIMLLNGLGELDSAFAVAEAYLLDRGPIISTLRWRPGEVSLNDQRRRKTNMLFVPVSAPMRSDPRFATLMADVGLEAYWRRAQVVPDHLRG